MLRSVHIRDDVHSKLRLEAFHQKVSLQGLINNILQEHIERKVN